LTPDLVYSCQMVDSHTIAVGVTLMGVAFTIRSMTAVLNATSGLIQAASRLAKMIVAFFKKPFLSIFVGLLKKTIHITSCDVLAPLRVNISF
jgi:hypothetical protein